MQPQRPNSNSSTKGKTHDPAALSAASATANGKPQAAGPAEANTSALGVRSEIAGVNAERELAAAAATAAPVQKGAAAVLASPAAAAAAFGGSGNPAAAAAAGRGWAAELHELRLLLESPARAASGERFQPARYINYL
jgi:hypothetical protein